MRKYAIGRLVFLEESFDSKEEAERFLKNIKVDPAEYVVINIDTVNNLTKKVKERGVDTYEYIDQLLDEDYFTYDKTEIDPEADKKFIDFLLENREVPEINPKDFDKE